MNIKLPRVPNIKDLARLRKKFAEVAILRRLACGVGLSFFVLAYLSSPGPESLEASEPDKVLASETPSLLEDLAGGSGMLNYSRKALEREIDFSGREEAREDYTNRVRKVKGLRDSVLVFAWRQRGVPYVWGGSSPNGFDCSGLLQFSFKKAGLNIPRTAAGQATMGKSVPIDEAWLAPGDLLVFQTRSSRYVDHIGMYLGQGQYIHASGKSNRVTLGSLRDPNDISNRILIEARRVFHLPYRQPTG